MKPAATSFCLMIAGAGLCFQSSTAFRAAEHSRFVGPRQDQLLPRPDSLRKNPGQNSGSAQSPRPVLMATDRLMIPPPPPLARPGKSFILGEQETRNRRGNNTLVVGPAFSMANPQPANVGAPAFRPGRSDAVSVQRQSIPQQQSRPEYRINETGITPTANSSRVMYASLNVTPQMESRAADPESLRIGEELRQLRDDPKSRRAFYDELTRSVELAREGKSDEPRVVAAVYDRQSEVATRASDLRKTTVGSISPAVDDQTSGDRRAPPQSFPQSSLRSLQEAIPASSGTTNGAIDRASYLMVVHWAKVNGTPIELALGVAWMESHLRQHPPRGGAGEVGMFQILPQRCVLEGWPAGRLNDPEFNARLGTLLLARYYKEEGSVARAAAKYVAGPGVFGKHYPSDVWDYINWYASSVNNYAEYFAQYQG